MITVLGIDPGLAKTGYGVIGKDSDKFIYIDCGVFSTSPKVDTGKRLDLIFEKIVHLIKEFRPDEAGIESLYFAKNITSAIPVAQARGVVLLAMEKQQVPAYEYAPQEIKRATVGNGRAEKSQVQELVRVLLGLKEVPKPDHAADALATALCHCNSRDFVQRMSGG
jgi:crossover junction endodeoxyribonuclease RuvC